MTINEIQMLQYMLSCFDEYMKSKQVELKNYKVVFKFRNHLLTGNTYETNQYHEPIKRTLDNEGDVAQYSPNFSQESKTDIMIIARRAFFKTFKGEMFYTPTAEYRTPHLLLPHLIKLVSSLGVTELENYGSTIFNPHFLDSEIELPFINVTENEQIDPISLISEN